MDQRRSDVAQDVREILETRNAISQKIEMLEHRIQETVEGTRTTVEEMVDRVKDAANEFVDRTKQTFDPTYQVHQHPWAMVGGAILVGYVLGLLESRVASGTRPSGVYPYYSPDAEQEGAHGMPTTGRWRGSATRILRTTQPTSRLQYGIHSQAGWTDNLHRTNRVRRDHGIGYHGY